MHRIINITSLVVLAGVVAYVFWLAFDRSRDRKVLVIKWVATLPVGWVIYAIVLPNFREGGLNAIFALVTTLFCGLAMAALWVGSVTDTFAKPFASLYDGGDQEVDPKPIYSIAISKQKKNRPLEAVLAIREQLAKFPNDYEGTMLLARIQAEDLKDLPSAEMTLNHFCEWDKAPAKQFAAALTQLADWHLKLFQDAYSARTALERVVEKYPDYDFALVAKQRIAHLAGSEKNLLAAQDRKPVFVPEGIKSVGLLESSAHLIPEETPPPEQAAAYVKHLEQHPDDTEAREKLAIIYARHYYRLDLAIAELEQMIAAPGHPAKRVAHWLNLLADLQIHGGADYDAVRATLEKIVDRFSEFAVAEVARSRLARLKLEFKAKDETPNKTLGVYEQNIGLKGNRYY